MIRCGAFCLTLDPAAGGRASRAAARIDRLGVRVRVHKDIALGGGKKGQLVALEFGGDGLPVCHGWLGDEANSGESSMLAEARGGIVASRDYCGTRPLYRATSGRWVATDHRFFPGEACELLPPRARLAVAKDVVRVPTSGKRRFVGSFEDAATTLASLIETSVRKRVEGTKRVAVAFSGGLDSSILAHCAAKYTKVVACSASAPGSLDRGVAGDAARAMGLEFASAKLDRVAIGREIQHLDLPFEPSPMDRGLWCIYSITSRVAREVEAEMVLLGQLADELFGGYAKYEAALRSKGVAEAEKMMSADVRGCGLRGFVRDEAACSRWSEPRFPFAEESVAMLGQSLPLAFKIRDGVRKAVLREAARTLGLTDEVVGKPKKAAQYSSGVLKLLG